MSKVEKGTQGCPALDRVSARGCTPDRGGQAFGSWAPPNPGQWDPGASQEHRGGNLDGRDLARAARHVLTCHMHSAIKVSGGDIDSSQTSLGRVSWIFLDQTDGVLSAKTPTGAGWNLGWKLPAVLEGQMSGGFQEQLHVEGGDSQERLESLSAGHPGSGTNH